MEKSELRKNAIHTLKSLSVSDKQMIEKQLMDQLQNSPVWKQASTIAITISQGFEWDTKPIIEAAWNAGKTVCAPKCEPKERRLDFYSFESFDQLEVVYYNLLEPKPESGKKLEKDDINLIVVPGVLFDRRGYRIGFGGGYYDRFLADYKNETISLVSEIQLVDELPVEPFDVPVHFIATESAILAAEA